MLVLALCTALLFGCEGRTLSGYSQSCTSTGGLFAGRTVTCSGEAESSSGSAGIEFGDQDDEELFGTYRLSAEISVQSGEARVYSYDADGERLPLGTPTIPRCASRGSSSSPSASPPSSSWTRERVRSGA